MNDSFQLFIRSIASALKLCQVQDETRRKSGRRHHFVCWKVPKTILDSHLHYAWLCIGLAWLGLAWTGFLFCFRFPIWSGGFS